MKKTHLRLLSAALLAAVVVAPLSAPAQAADAARMYSSAPAGVETVRVKDVAQIRGARSNQLVGFGLVVGLNGTGDSQAAGFTDQAIANMIERFGLTGLRGRIKVKNVAAVLVTANIPPFAKAGQPIDVTISSLGDAKSLESGFLVQTPLKGADGRIYAVAQGAVSLGGFGVEAGNASVKKNATTVGRVPNGGLVEKEIQSTVIDENGYLHINLINPDYSTATELATKINKLLLSSAEAIDPATIRVFIPEADRPNLVYLLAKIENLALSAQNNAAKVVIEERTGTLIIGQNVRIGPVAVSHGGLTIKIESTPVVSQPLPMSQGQTTVTNPTTITAEESQGSTVVLDTGSTVGALVKSLNALGVPPRDLITIIQSIKAAGALNAHLEII